MNKPKILLVDIETAPIEAYVWQKSIYNASIQPEQIVGDTHLLSFAAKWLGEKAVLYEDQSHSRKMSDDTRLLKSINGLLDEADIVIAHNGQAFDLPFVRARMAGANLLPPSPYRQIDTYRVAKNQFGFTFNKLEFLGRALGCKVRKNPHKKFPGIELWKQCLARNQEAWKEMKIYNIDDVLLLEEVYLKMRPWIVQHPNVGVYYDSERPLCPKCGSDHMTKSKNRITRAGKYTQYQCQNCGGYARGNTQLLSIEKRKLQLHN